jgi:hypothetical protein
MHNQRETYRGSFRINGAHYKRVLQERLVLEPDAFKALPEEPRHKVFHKNGVHPVNVSDLAVKHAVSSITDGVQTVEILRIGSGIWVACEGQRCKTKYQCESMK